MNCPNCGRSLGIITREEERRSRRFAWGERRQRGHQLKFLRGFTFCAHRSQNEYTWGRGCTRETAPSILGSTRPDDRLDAGRDCMNMCPTRSARCEDSGMPILRNGAGANFSREAKSANRSARSVWPLDLTLNQRKGSSWCLKLISLIPVRRVLPPSWSQTPVKNHTTDKLNPQGQIADLNT